MRSAPCRTRLAGLGRPEARGGAYGRQAPHTCGRPGGVGGVLRACRARPAMPVGLPSSLPSRNSGARRGSGEEWVEVWQAILGVEARVRRGRSRAELRRSGGALGGRRGIRGARGGDRRPGRSPSEMARVADAVERLLAQGSGNIGGHLPRGGRGPRAPGAAARGAWHGLRRPDRDGGRAARRHDDPAGPRGLLREGLPPRGAACALAASCGRSTWQGSRRRRRRTRLRSGSLTKCRRMRSSPTSGASRRRRTRSGARSGAWRGCSCRAGPSSFRAVGRAFPASRRRGTGWGLPSPRAGPPCASSRRGPRSRCPPARSSRPSASFLPEKGPAPAPPGKSVFAHVTLTTCRRAAAVAWSRRHPGRGEPGDLAREARVELLARRRGAQGARRAVRPVLARPSDGRRPRGS